MGKERIELSQHCYYWILSPTRLPVPPFALKYLISYNINNSIKTFNILKENMLKELYFKTINLAGHKNSKIFLGIMSFIESFVFPIPPDVLIIPMTIAKKHDWVRIALIATVGSVLGACLGYFIGYVFFNEIGIKIFELYGVDNASFLKDKMSSEGGTIAWMTLLAIAGFSPIPFKLLTITSGFINFNLFYFIIISLLTRGLRFFFNCFSYWKFWFDYEKNHRKKIIKIFYNFIYSFNYVFLFNLQIFDKFYQLK